MASADHSTNYPMAIYRCRVATAALTFMFVVSLLAGTSLAMAKEIRVSGMGVRKCTEWQKWKETQNGEARAMTLEWAQGFIAGHNVYASSRTQSANSVVADDKVLVPLLDIFCQKNPESRIFSGVIEITKSLGGAKINLTPSAPPRQNPQPDKKGEQES